MERRQFRKERGKDSIFGNKESREKYFISSL
jgi:hypothetical protein